jgi:hypothetical protein
VHSAARSHGPRNAEERRDYCAPAALGYPWLVQAWNPPYSAETLVKPLFCRMSAAPALDSSLGHVQYVTIGLSFGRVLDIDSMLANGMCNAPGM